MAYPAIVVLTLTWKLVFSMRSAATFRRIRYCSSGFTLFELIVALAVMSVAIALAGPALVLRKADASELMANLISDSRRTATRRAQSLQLDVDAEGEWILSAGADGSLSEVRRGRITPSSGAARIRISPLGICVSGNAAPIRIDPLTCVLQPVNIP